MNAREAREKVIEQHTAQEAVSDILMRIEEEIERQEYYFNEGINKFYIIVDYNYNLDVVIENRTEQVIQELNSLGFEIVKSPPQNKMLIYW